VIANSEYSYKQYLYNQSFLAKTTISFFASPEFKSLLLTNFLSVIHAPPYFE